MGLTESMENSNENAANDDPTTRKHEMIRRTLAASKYELLNMKKKDGKPMLLLRNLTHYANKWNGPNRSMNDIELEGLPQCADMPHYLNELPDRERLNNTNFEDSTFFYDTEFVQSLLHSTHILMIGDSIMRGVYKDLLTLLNTNLLTHERSLTDKASPSYMNDRQIDILKLSGDRLFVQAREYCVEDCLIQFIFTTRCMRSDMAKKLLDFILPDYSNDDFPDVIVMNSALWDLTRYKLYLYKSLNDATNEASIYEEYLDRLSQFLRRLRLLKPMTKFIWINFPWTQAPKESQEPKGFCNKADIRLDKKLYSTIYMEGAFRAAQVVRNAGYDVLDMGFYMRNHALHPFRKDDGVHWDRVGTRLMTQLLIGHLAQMWNIDVRMYKSSGNKKPVEARINEAIKKMQDPDYQVAANILQTFDRSTTIQHENSGNWPDRIHSEIRRRMVQMPEMIEILPTVRSLLKYSRCAIQLLRYYDAGHDRITLHQKDVFDMENIFKELSKTFYVPKFNKLKSQALHVSRKLKGPNHVVPIGLGRKRKHTNEFAGPSEKRSRLLY